MAGSPEPVATAPDACWPEPSEWNQTITVTANAAPRSVEVIGLITPSSCNTHPEPDLFTKTDLPYTPGCETEFWVAPCCAGIAGDTSMLKSLAPRIASWARPRSTMRKTVL